MAFSIESLIFQGKHNKLANGLVNVFEDAIEKNVNGDFKSARDSLDGIVGIVKGITGINLSVKVEPASTFAKAFGSPYNVHVDSLKSFTYQSIANPKATKRIEDIELGSESLLEWVDGSIDFKKGTVSGFYSKVVFTVTFTDLILDGKITPEELAAIVLHEVGHAWTILISIGMGTATSAFALGIDDFLNREEDPNKRLSFVQARLKKKAVTLPADNEGIINLLVADAVIRESSKIGIDFKSIEAGERLADQFANRWGMGVSLLKALKKLTELNGFNARLGVTPVYSGILSTSMWVLISPFVKMIPVSAKSLPNLVNPALFAKAFVFQMALSLVTGILTNMLLKHGHHPDIKSRMIAIRQDNIAILRSPGITNKERDAILEDITSIDELIKSVSFWDNKLQKLFTNLSGYLTGNTQKENLKDSIRERTNNSLHELAARIEANK